MRNDRPHRVISATPLELENPHYPVVIKEDGLCGGKGVVICKTKEEIWRNLPHMFINNIYKSNSNKILVEDFVVGEEASCFVLSDGYDYKMLPFCKDHKRLQDNDKGPNTGGMGAYAPTPIVNKKTQDDIRKRIVEPTLIGMRSEGIPFKGVLYIGLMISPIAGPQVIEYNVRFGDPECQVLMMLWEDDLYDFLYATAKGGLGNMPDPTFYNGDALTVTLCSQGYPQEYETGYAITGLDINKPDVQIFHAGVKDGMTAGGRVLNVTARGESLDNARETVYNTIKDISFENMIYRTDIGKANG
jgi:phosphoribosylamine--glycine ligase